MSVEFTSMVPRRSLTLGNHDQKAAEALGHAAGVLEIGLTAQDMCEPIDVYKKGKDGKMEFSHKESSIFGKAWEKLYRLFVGYGTEYASQSGRNDEKTTGQKLPVAKE